MIKLRRYQVTVMDNWTPARRFWTVAGARRFAARVGGHAYVWMWVDGRGWKLHVPLGPLVNVWNSNPKNPYCGEPPFGSRIHD